MNEDSTPASDQTGIAGRVAGCLFHLDTDGALSVQRPATPDQEEIAIELTASAVAALCVLFDTVDMSHLLERLAARRGDVMADQYLSHYKRAA